MSNIYRVDIKADDCPIQMWDGNLTIDANINYVNRDLFNELTGYNYSLVRKLSVGDKIYICYIDTVYKLGDKYNDTSLVCVKVVYKPRKWWQKLMFWKKREIIGYIFRMTE